MNLTSCANCGVVLDADKLSFPRDIYDAEGYIVDTSKAAWDGEHWVAFARCPVCHEPVFRRSE